MQVTTHELDPCTLSFEIEVELERVNRAFDRAVKQLSRKLRIPGFRPGQAPRSVVQQFLSEADIKREAAQILVVDTLSRAMEAAQVNPYAMPQIEIDQVEENEPFRFKAVVPLAPKIELGNYQGIMLRRVKQEVYPQELEAALSDIQRQTVAFNAVEERGAQGDDHAVISLRSLEDANSEAERYRVTVGRTFGELDNVLAGMKKGETKTTTITFPEDFQNPDLAGKMKSVEIQLLDLYEPVVPEQDDALAQRVGYATLDALKEGVTDAILAEKEERERRRMQGELLNQIRECSQIVLPRTLIEEQAEQDLNRLESDLNERGLSLATYALQAGVSEEEIKNRIAQDAEIRTQNSYLLSEIASREKIRVQDEDINAEIDKIASDAGYDMARIARLKQDDRVRHRVRSDLLMNRVLDYLMSQAQIEETTGGTTEDA